MLATTVNHVELSPTYFVLIWAGSGALAAFVPLRAFAGSHLQAPSLRRFRDRSYLGYRFVWEYVFVRASSQSLYIVLGLLAGLAATGGLRGAIALFGPLTVIILAASSFGIPIIRSLAPVHRDGALLGASMVLVFLCITWTLAIQLTPDPLGIRILGETWEGARDFSLAVGTQTAFTAGSAMAYVALRLVAPLSTLTLSILPAIVLPSMFFVATSSVGPLAPFGASPAVLRPKPPVRYSSISGFELAGEGSRPTDREASGLVIGYAIHSLPDSKQPETAAAGLADLRAIWQRLVHSLRPGDARRASISGPMAWRAAIAFLSTPSSIASTARRADSSANCASSNERSVTRASPAYDSASSAASFRSLTATSYGMISPQVAAYSETLSTSKATLGTSKAVATM